MSEKKDFLERELEICINLEDEKRKDVEMFIESFSKEPNLKDAYELRKCLSGWITTKEKYDFYKKVYDFGWGQDDTKHE